MKLDARFQIPNHFENTLLQVFVLSLKEAKRTLLNLLNFSSSIIKLGLKEAV